MKYSKKSLLSKPRFVIYIAIGIAVLIFVLADM